MGLDCDDEFRVCPCIPYMTCEWRYMYLKRSYNQCEDCQDKKCDTPCHPVNAKRPPCCIVQSFQITETSRHFLDKENSDD